MEEFSPSSSYRRLDPIKLIGSIDLIRDQVLEEFPAAGLSKVAKQISTEAREIVELAKELRKPLWGVRIGAGALILLSLVWPLILAPFLQFKEYFTSLADFLEATDAGLHMILVVGAGVVFLVGWENRIKRNKALKSLAELRSLAHIIDMHQVTKDPCGLDAVRSQRSGSVKSDEELALYLDYSSDMLAMLGKLAAFHVQDLQDRVVLDAVNEVESLTNALSAKLWQKIMVINHIAEVQARCELP